MRANRFHRHLTLVLLLAASYARSESLNISASWAAVNGTGIGQISFLNELGECLHVVTSGGVDLTSTDTPPGYNFLCSRSYGYPITAYVKSNNNLTRSLVAGEQVKLCRANNLSSCSNLVTVDSMFATLSSVRVGEGFVQWSYRLNYGTCSHPYFQSAPTGIVPLSRNLWCQRSPDQDFTATIIQDLYSRPVVVGDQIMFLGGNSETSYGPVTVGVLPSSVKLNYVLVGDGKVTVSYDKNFTTCAHLLRPNNQIVHVPNLFCYAERNDNGRIADSERETILIRPDSDYTTTLVPGEKLKLCHGNNYNICSALVTVNSTVVAPPDSVSLGYVVVGGGKVKLAYKKNFSACVQLVPVSGTPAYHTASFYCDKDKDTEISLSDSGFNVVPAAGTKVKLCSVANANVCSPLVEVEALPPDTSACH